MRLSISMIVKNEESCLAQCLESVKGADEIIIVDTGSTDKTCEIARCYTDKVYEGEYVWEDSFCKARNYALNKCTGDWILSIDADEILEPNGIQKIRDAIAFLTTPNQKTINCRLVANITNILHYFPRVFERCPEVFWKGDIHNCLSVSETNKSDITIVYKYSEAHKNDPDRALRILIKTVKENPKIVRETFYLAREYYYRKDYVTAIHWYKDYLTRAYWGPEWAEAWLTLSRCYWNLGKINEAKDACLQAIKINANFREALELMADLSGPKNRLAWLNYSEFANNEDVFMIRTKQEKKSDYYDKLFLNNSDMSRYKAIHELICELVGNSVVLDVGCGTGELQNYIKQYYGFDFSKEAIKIANNPNVWVGDVYDEKNYDDCGIEIFVITEVLEHVDDKKVLANVPKGKKVICSVPSFDDPSHLRTYNRETVDIRIGEFLNITKVHRFNWRGKWELGGKDTTSYILLIEGVKK